MYSGAHEMPKQRRSLNQWQAIIAEFHSSGLSRDEFCTLRKLNREYFSKRLRSSKKSTPSRPAFLPVRVRSEAIAIELGDVTVRCSTEVSVAWIADLAAALRR
jgi:hypothetical protein